VSQVVPFQKVDEPPHSVEAEQVVLGALLLSLDGLHEAKSRGGTRLFYDPVHESIFALICEKEKRGELVSPVALAEWAKGNDAFSDLGGPGYLARLAGAATTASQFPYYIDMLADLSAKRGVQKALTVASDGIADGDSRCDAIIARLDADIAALDVQGGAQTVSMLRAVTVAMQNALAAKQGERSGLVPTGIGRLDDMVGGFRPGELILLGGRPSMGKSSVALNIALNAARSGTPVIICSLEMNPEAMAVRAISEETGRQGKAVTYREILNGSIVDWQMDAATEAAKKVAELPIQFLTREFSDLASMRAGVVQAQKVLGGKAGLLVIDYAQLLRSQAKSRYEQITEISIELKALAGKMNLPVLALSQLSRALEQRDEKRPMLSDLRESGQLEQDADTVLFCYRDEYYLERDKPEAGLDEGALEAWQDAMERARNRLEIIVAKQRQGPIGTANVMCNVALNRIWER